MGVTTNVIAKMGKNENVSTEALYKICKVLDCQLDDIMELVEEISAQ
jgi:DNA-binding Xre family transcriptional regulator